MWIIPRTSRFSHFVPATAVSNSDWPAHWRTLCESLLWRSKPTHWRTWSQRLRRASWLSRLCGRICEPSRQSDFEDALISSFRAIRANHFRSQASVKEPTIPDTFGRLLLESSRQLSLFGASSRTSPDTLASDSPTFIAAYEIWVTKLRLDCLQRQSAARLTSGNGSLSWPTVRANETCQYNSKDNGVALSRAVKQWPTPEAQNQEGYQVVNGKKIPRLGQQVNWPTARASDGEHGGPNQRDSAGRPALSMAVNWPTPQHSEYKGQSQRGQHCPDDRLTNKVLSGQPAPDSPSMNGKSRELWATPNIPDRGGPGGQHSDLAIDLNCAPRKLNPAWVEQLMGLPTGWTAFDSSETESSLSRRKKRSGPCMSK